MPPAGAVAAAEAGRRQRLAAGGDSSASPPASPPPGSPDEGQDRLVAALLLRNAKTKVEQAEENGMSAYLEDSRMNKRINERLLKGEVSQARSFNRRTGIGTLPEQEGGPGDSVSVREVKALEREWVRSAHQLREGQRSPEALTLTVEPRKRQRVGANGASLDLAAVEEAEARLADEDAEMANPLLRPPPVLLSKASVAKKGLVRLASNSGGQNIPGPPLPGEQVAKREHCQLWPSKGMRVRVVDENGEFKKSNLKKGIVRQRHANRGAVDVELDDPKGNGSAGGGRLLRLVPQTLLETVVSKSCKRIEVVRGTLQGVIAELVSRDSGRNVAMIRLGRAQGQEAVELPVDDICEFV